MLNIYVVNSKRGWRSPSRLRSADESHPPSPVPSPCICSSRSTSFRFSALRAQKYTRIPTEDAAVPIEKERLTQGAFLKCGGSVKSQVDTIPPELVAIKPIAMAVARR